MIDFWLFLGCLLAIPFILLIIIRLLLSVTTVWGKSMYPTLDHGDRVLLLRYWPTRWLRKDQIVVGELPEEQLVESDVRIRYSDRDRVLPPGWSRQDLITVGELSTKPDGRVKEGFYIKRVIGLPGDTVTINISDLHEIMRPGLQEKCDDKGNLIWHIPNGHYFVKGDGPISGDSVNWGPIPLKSFVGIVLLKLPRRADMNKIKPPPGYFPESIQVQVWMP